MNRARSLLLATGLFATATLSAEEATPAGSPPAATAPTTSLTNRCILLVNAAGLPAAELETLRAFAEKDLWVKVKSLDFAGDWAALPGKLSSLQSAEAPVVVALAKNDSATRFVSAPDNGWAIVNMSAIPPVEGKQEHMEKRQMMRGIGYALGLSACFNFQCCMYVRQKNETFTQAGNNYCPVCRQHYITLTMFHGLKASRPAIKRSVTLPAPAPDAKN